MKIGRPTKYRDEYARMAYEACKHGGFTVRKLAALFGVNKDTITEWKKVHPNFSVQVVRGNDEYNVSIAEKHLFRRVTGYKHTKTTREPQIVRDTAGNAVKDERGQPVTEMVVTKTVRETIHPDTRAIEYYLSRRDPERWPNKAQLEVSGPGGGPLQAKVEPDMDAKEAMEAFKRVVKGDE